MKRLRAAWFFRRHTIERVKEDAMHWLARHLPRRLATWSFITVVAYATTGKYGDTVVPELSAMEALKRWEER